jgi:LAO/AO transport system kinase
MEIIDDILNGNRLALARLLTQIENNTSESRLLLNELFPYTGQAYMIGITGAPGTGKSTLVNQLARAFRSETRRREKLYEEFPYSVGIVAVDPSSPFTGGAILGDRVRMGDLAGDNDIFIRSMASRGSLGGLTKTTFGIVQALDAAGFKIIFIETMGAGQAEVDIARLAHTTLVIESPGMGDDIQAIKAGILEIADILVINKADRPGVEAAELALQNMLLLAHPGPHNIKDHQKFKPSDPKEFNFSSDLSNLERQEDQDEDPKWIPPICRTIAIKGSGITELVGSILKHKQYLHISGELEFRDKTRLQSQLDMLIHDNLISKWRKTVPQTRYQEILGKLIKREISPWNAANLLIKGEIY